MAIKREIKWVYRALLKDNGKVVSVKELVGLYAEYEEFRQKIIKSNIAPGSLRSQLSPLRVPNYIKWISQYLTEDDKK